MSDQLTLINEVADLSQISDMFLQYPYVSGTLYIVQSCHRLHVKLNVVTLYDVYDVFIKDTGEISLLYTSTSGSPIPGKAVFPDGRSSTHGRLQIQSWVLLSYESFANAHKSDAIADWNRAMRVL